MTTLAEVNASLGVTNIALSDVAKEQKETNKGISKFVEFMQDKDTRDRREDIEEKRERKASVISSVGAGAGAIGSGAVNLGKKGFGLGKDLFSKLGGIIPIGLAGAFLTSLVGSKLFRGGIAGLGIMFGDQIAEYLTGEDAKQEVKDQLAGVIKGGALGFLLGPRFALIGGILGGLLKNQKVDEQAGKLLTNLENFEVKFPKLSKFFGGLGDAVGSGLESINNLLAGTSENKIKDIAKSIALVGGVATLLMPGKILGLLAGATRLLMASPAGLALLAIGGGGLLANKLMGNNITEGEIDPTAFGTGALITGAGVYGAKRFTRGVPTAADDAARSQQARGRTLTGAPKDMRRTSTGAGSKFDRMMDVNLKGLSKYPRLLSFVKMVGRTGPLAALFGIGQIIQMASTGTLNAESLGKVFGGLIGGVGGTKLGAAIGSIFPGPGTLLGGLIGGGLGFFAGEYIAGKLANFLLGTDDGEFKKAGNPRAARAQAAAMKRGEELAKTYKSEVSSGVRNQIETNSYGTNNNNMDPTGNPTGDVNMLNSNNRTVTTNNNAGVVLDNSGAIDRKDNLSSQIKNPSNLF